jgi:hypothetical protein
MGAWFVHLPNGWMFTAPNGGWEYPAFLIFALSTQAMLGDGTNIQAVNSTRDFRSEKPRDRHHSAS